MVKDKKPRRERFLNPPAHAYSLLLASLIGLWLISPLVDMLHAERFSSTFFISITLVAACYSMMDQGKSFLVVVALGVMLLVLLWLGFGGDVSRWTFLFTEVVALLFFAVVAYELLIDILAKESRVDSNLIAGAISVYLLIGVCFSFVYQLIFTLDPEAFRGAISHSDRYATFTYFSFVTLTTLGYGDITPTTKIGGNMATLEAIIGQLYLTVLVARLVGMHISQGQSDAGSGR